MTSPDEARSGTVGLIALVVTVLVWSGFFLSLRLGARIHLPPVEIALLRFAPGTLVFLPILLRHRARILAAPRLPLALMVVGSGFPYLIVAAFGMSLAPVADGSTLLPGLNPLLVSILGLLVFGRSIGRRRLLGLILILGGIGLLVGHSLLNPTPGLTRGYLVLLGAGLMWATFTLAFERSGLRPIEGAAVITFGSIALLLVTLMVRWRPLEMLEIDPSSVLPVFIAQGIGVGLLSTVAYTTAVKHLGATRAAMAGALTPVLSTLLAIPLLDERPHTDALLGLLVIVTGVALANRSGPRKEATPAEDDASDAPP